MTAVPEVVDAVVALANTVIDTVSDGSPHVWPDEDAIIVGWAREGGGVTVDTSPAGFVSTDQETVTVSCLITCVGGDATVKPLRNRAFGYYNAVATTVRNDKTLGGAVANARLSSASANQFLNESGALVELTFTVSCIAFI